VLRAATPFNFCVIDEVDSILIDEARTPLIISGVSDKPSDKYFKAAKIADALSKDVHYTVDEKQKSVLLTEDGWVFAVWGGVGPKRTAFGKEQLGLMIGCGGITPAAWLLL
jgi:preprotein translocase subunit SecA